LTNIEQKLFRTLGNHLDFDIDSLDNNEAFHISFDVINNNISLKIEARKYLQHAVQTNKISRHNYNQIMNDLHL
jgi:hypothetical protein